LKCTEYTKKALLDLVVMKYLFDKFPQANSEQLSVMRTGAICASALASVAIRRLELYKVMLINNVELSLAIGRCVALLEDVSGQDIVENGWRYDTPKPISDVLESVLGAVLIDSAYNFDITSSVVEFVMEDVLTPLSPSSCRNPITRLLEWMASLGCRDISFQ
jgi:endoribonuclease Dicer